MQDQLQQKGLLQALQLLLTLRKLDSSIVQGPQSQLQLMRTGVSLFVDAGILGLSGGMFLNTCLKALAPYFTGELCAAVMVCDAALACKTSDVAGASCICSDGCVCNIELCTAWTSKLLGSFFLLHIGHGWCVPFLCCPF